MATDLTAKNQNILRRRMHILERAQNTFSSKSDDPLASNHHQANEEEEEEEEDEKEHSPSDYESDSESSEPTSASPQRPPPLGIDTSVPYEKDHSSSPTSPSTRAWYEFYLAVVVALVSPIGNWLTGGDHVKNLLLIILLIFYLHQIIESTYIISFS